MRAAAAALALATGVFASAAMAQPQPAGCTASIALPWSAAGKLYRMTASVTGRNCESANVVLMIRAPTGVMLNFTSAAADLPPMFGQATTPQAMQAALRAWIAQGSVTRSTRDLPPWKDDEAEPRGARLTLQPEPDVDRTSYAKLRQWGQPMFCFAQGRIGTACYALDGTSDRLTLIGVTTSIE